MRSSPNLIYRLLHKDYPESFRVYSPHTEDFYELVHSQLPKGWSIERRDIWFYCSPSLQTAPLQGWKIHISAKSENSRQVLEKIISVLLKYNDVSFKFALDRSLLSLLNSKGWPRGGSGKFITIYPPNSHRFLELIEEVDQATAGMQGPYILSDQRYKNSQVVFYRYGGMKMHTALDVKGERVPVLKNPNGALIPDQRHAYPILPEWERPILPEESSEVGKADGLTLFHGRYTIKTAITFSSAGGIYVARDNHTGQRVVAKEARPHVGTATDDYDAVALLKKEYRLLKILADTRIVPQPVDLFQEWEHWFLVEEFIEGITMSHHSVSSNILLRTRTTKRDREEWCAMFSRLCMDVIRILKILHSRKIVFADLSTNNLMVTANGQELKIIDFEGAYQVGVDRPVNLYTPGFVSQYRIAGGQARVEDDYYSAGAALLAYLLPINGLLHLNPQARRVFLASIRDDIQLPESIADLINNLMDHPESFASAPATRVEVSGPYLPRAYENSMSPSCDYQVAVDDIASHFNSIAECQRTDRLYPADPRVFSTNPLSLAYGAVGVAYALHRIAGNVPQSVIDWILEHQVTSTEYPPGLYVGMSGIAWSLLEIGLREQAEAIFQLTFKHPLLNQSPDLFYGIAGWGMTGLRFFQATGKEIYVEKAREAGNALLASCRKSECGYHWSTSDECALGLAHGSSGIGLFLLYLYLATRNETYLAPALQALDFDLAAAVRTQDGGLSWPESLDSTSPLYPFWRFGSAGVGIATARFQRLIGSPRYATTLEQIFIDTDRKYAVIPGHFSGLAGLGEFLLDLYELSGEQRFLKSANRVAEGIMQFRVERNGAAFPGELSSRLCCDYGTGSAGIALFLNRLLGRQKSDFMLDGLFCESPCKSSDHETSVKALYACAPT